MALAIIIGMLMEKLNSLIQREFGFIFGVQKDMEKLRNMLSTIHDVAEDLEMKPIKEKEIAKWITDLKDAVYDASDALEELSMEAHQQQQQHPEEQMKMGPAHPAHSGTAYSSAISKQGSGSVSGSVLSLFNFDKGRKLALRRKIAKTVKEIISRLDMIEELRTGRSRPYFHTQFDELTETGPISNEARIIFGRDADKETVINMLLGSVVSHVEEENVSIIPIVGMGGIGKTTLAQMVYNDERVVMFFEARLWVHASDPFDVTKVLKEIIESYYGKACDVENVKSIQNKVGEILRNKRYLLVLDDMWNEDSDEWNNLKNYLMGGAKGSSVIVTTRLSIVASITSSIPEYHLEPLYGDDCWSLFKSHAFSSRSEEKLSLAVLRGEIVEKCNGLPLAAKFLGNLMGLKIDENEWAFAIERKIWELPENEIMSSLKLSSNHLSPCSRLCFAYCSLFPKRCLLKKDDLIGLWIANGFIQFHGGMEPEDIGDVIFDDLLRRSFFQDPTEDIYGNVVACKMHDLMHDLASFLMVGECSASEIDNNADALKEIRHLSLLCLSAGLSISLDPIFKSLPSLRTLFLVPHRPNDYPCIFDASRLRCLRALNLMGMSLETLPSSVCHLKHLRYLNLSMTHITSLPESINKLRNLQVLDLSENKGITTLPLSTGDLQCLRYFNLSQCSIRSLPESIHKLRNLQKLDMSGNKEFTTLPVSIGSMQSLRYLILSECSITTLPESICNLRNLQLLDLSGNEEITTLPFSMGDLHSLTHFNLTRCSLVSLPESIVNLSKLQMLDLSRNYSITALPFSIEYLQSLRCLNLSDCSLVTSLPESVGQLRSLHSLILSGCSSLGVLPETIGNMSSLRHLDIYGCRKLTKMPIGIGKLTRLQTLNLFTVGRPDRDSGCGGIRELQGLNQLDGELEIQGLENITNSDHAREANLSCKYYLEKLKLSWGHVHSWEESNTNDVLEGLQLPPNIWQLVIDNYPLAAGFPQGFIENLNGLQSLQISNCKELVSLPAELQKLTALEELQIESCDSLTSLTEGLMYQTSLRTLLCQHCPKLELGNGDFQHLISLLYLRLEWLPKLRALPEGIQELTSLQHLEIGYCWNLRRLPALQHLTSLDTLKIYYCPELQLEKDDFEHLVSLQTLKLGFLPKLKAFPEGIQNLTMLRKLKLLRCENLKMLPDCLEHLAGLQLKIENCHQSLHRRYQKAQGIGI